ncbi:hypothetical protein [Variovorax paradoxus]|uniref:hypothetical protein n=1 Tax=Variovorax paradoxus TaxID=34073 RepID=UPI00286494D4|nr:hypothetical protein [Variovorax paradoxus]MDR6453469.1 integrase [Variovorax paradoxus]
MTKRIAVDEPVEVFAQPRQVEGLNAEQRDDLIISMREVDGAWVVVSRYRDDCWWLTGAPTNVSKSNTKLDFARLPTLFRATAKAMFYRRMANGLRGRKRAGATSLVSNFGNMCHFLKYVDDLGINRLSEISPFVCSTYAQACQAPKADGNESPGEWRGRRPGEVLSKGAIMKRLSAVEAIYELSQYTEDPMPKHPWPDTSAEGISGYSKSKRAGTNKTPLMSDVVFTTLFQRAWAIVQSAEPILDLRDKLDNFSPSPMALNASYAKSLKWQALTGFGWKEGAAKFVASLLDIRTACYIVVASLSGCRNHELSFIQRNAYYSTEDNQGERYWWMRSRSTKTGEGTTEWMIPEAAVTALRVMDRWAAPYQAQLRKQIEAYRAHDPGDIRIAEAQEHLGAIFVGADNGNELQVRTISLTWMNTLLKEFSRSCGLSWNLASHQFRRKFANYAARSRFGDLRYLREHFKHWSLDMTLGYGLNESQEMALYLEIEDELDDIKQEVVAGWLDKTAPLAGGYGKNLASWRSREESIVLFRSHAHMVRSIAESTAIRSNGHAWCTADDQSCDGNDIDPSRCGGNGEDGRGCDSAVIGRQHAPIYGKLYNELKLLEDCDDIGEGGRMRIARDLERCRSVFITLGQDPLEFVA